MTCSGKLSIMDYPLAARDFLNEIEQAEETARKEQSELVYQEKRESRKQRQKQLKIDALEPELLNRYDIQMYMWFAIGWLLCPLIAASFYYFGFIVPAGILFSATMMGTIVGCFFRCCCLNISIFHRNRRRALAAARLGRAQLESLSDLQDYIHIDC
jgi:hypothetical protein